MTLEDKMKRNIKQIEDTGKCPRKFYLEKFIEEVDELDEEHMKQFVSSILKRKTNLENLYGEIADVLNCIKYLTILFGLDRDKIDSIRNYKVDRGYERGNNNG